MDFVPGESGHWWMLSNPELEALSTGQTGDRVAARIRDLLSGRLQPHSERTPLGTPRIETLASGARRIRALVPDSDSDLAYSEDDTYVGIVASGTGSTVYIESISPNVPAEEVYSFDLDNPEETFTGFAIKQDEGAAALDALHAFRDLLYLTGRLKRHHYAWDYDGGYNTENWPAFANPDLQ